MKIAVRHRSIERIPVLEVVSEESRSEALPLLIYYHGWQSSKELVLTQARKIARLGVRVILPDAMFHGERKLGEPSSIPSVTFWSSIQHNILEFSVLVRFFEKKQMIERDLIAVGGVSMGGITTCALLTQHPEIQAAACVMGTPSPLSYIDLVISSAAKRQIAVPKDLRLALSWVGHYDLAQRPEMIANRPFLFWHGKLDEKIPYEAAYDFYNTIKAEKYAQNTVFLTDEHERHLVRGDVMDQIAAFYEKNFLKK